MSDCHAKATERAFTRQAETHADARFNRVLTSESEWVFARLPVHAHDPLLDLAAGTGLGSRALAPKVRSVVALDATPAMLEVGRAEAERDGLANIVFQRGDAVEQQAHLERAGRAALRPGEWGLQHHLCRGASHDIHG